MIVQNEILKSLKKFRMPFAFNEKKRIKNTMP